MKLTARGRTVLAQVSRVTTTPGEAAFEAGGIDVPASQPRKLRTELALLSDGVIGIKHTFLKPDGTVDHSAGWKVRSKFAKAETIKAIKNPEHPQHYEVIRKWVGRYVGEGFARTK